MTDAAAEAAQLVRRLAASGRTLAVAESLTGGGLGARLTAVPGASAVFAGGVLSYATRVKVDLLGVPADLVARDGVVSGACAEAMAAGVRRLLGSDLALAVTGVAGPDTQEGKPVGRVHVGLADASGTRSEQLQVDGDREAVRAAAVLAALRLALGSLAENTGREVAGPG